MKKEALLVVDMLNDFVLPGAPLEVPNSINAIPVIRSEIDKAHAVGNPVIYVCDAHAPDDKEFRKFGWPAHGVKGTKGAQVIDELKPSPVDTIVSKNTYSGFFGTLLDATLKRLDVDAVRLTGVVTHICILFISYEAVLRDYEVTIVEDGIAGIGQDDHDAALRIMKNVLAARVMKTGIEVGRKAA